jgi:hypothetical protein
MITIKLPYKCQDDTFYPVIQDLRRVQSSFVRSAYQLFYKGYPQSQVQKDEGLNYKFKLGSWFRQSGVMLAKSIHTRNKDSKVIFGGQFNLKMRANGKISKEDWKDKRLMPLNVQGESSKSGNRHFELNVIDSNSIIFKVSRSQHFKIELPRLRNNIRRKLTVLEESTKLNAQPFQVQLTDTHIFITFEESREPIKDKVIRNRFVGIDMNPGSVGISVVEMDEDRIKVLHTQEFSVSVIIDKIKTLNVSSDNSKSKHLNNKLNHETIEISKSIVNIAKSFNCKGIFIEDLNFRNSQQGKSLNRNNKNLWKRGLITENLRKRSQINNLSFYEVSPQYSSQIGNLMYDFTDPINASIEIARRGYQVIFEKNKNKRKFYPNFSLDRLKDQWKEHFFDCKEWKQVFLKIKNSGLKYRVSSADIKIGRVFSLKCEMSNVKYHCCS